MADEVDLKALDAESLALGLHGGQELVDYLVGRGLQAKHAGAVACFVHAVSFAVCEPEQYSAAFMLVNEGIQLLEAANNGSETAQVRHLPLLGIVDERVIGLVSNLTMQDFEVATNGDEERQRTWLIRQAAVKGG